MPELLSGGQTSYRLGPTGVLPRATSLNIVQRLGHRALTGRGLGVVAQQHYGYRVYFEIKGEFGSRNFETRFPSYRSCHRFCICVVRGSPVGLCECMVMREGLKVRCRLLYIGRYEPLCAEALLNKTLWEEMRWKPWPETEVKDLPRRGRDSGDKGPWCNCTVTSSGGPRYFATGGDK